jgi:hypothetical protein
MKSMQISRLLIVFMRQRTAHIPCSKRTTCWEKSGFTEAKSHQKATHNQADWGTEGWEARKHVTAGRRGKLQNALKMLLSAEGGDIYYIDGTGIS